MADAQTPLLRWAGSKRQIVADLASYWPPDANRYIEPFCGSACLFFHFAPQSAILGDINHALVGAYRTIRSQPKTVWASYRKLRGNKTTYYKVRRMQPATLHASDKAARFVFLNRYCFNGLYRTNTRGVFNVPFGGRNQAILTRKHFTEVARLLRRAKLITADFRETLKEAKRGDFVYLDPPYALESRRIFSEYHEDSFTMHDIRSLCEELRRLTAIGAWFLLSYADTTATRAVFGEWFCRRIVTRRNIAGFAGHRKNSHELLVANFPLPRLV